MIRAGPQLGLSDVKSNRLVSNTFVLRHGYSCHIYASGHACETYSKTLKKSHLHIQVTANQFSSSMQCCEERAITSVLSSSSKQIT